MIQINPKKIAHGLLAFIIGFFLMMAAMSLLSGCATQKRCAEKFPPQVTVEHTFSEKIIQRDSLLPGSTVSFHTHKDSVIVHDRIIHVRDPKGLAEMRILLDSIGRLLSAECEAKDRLVEKIEKVQAKETKEESVHIKPERKIPAGYWILLGLIIGVVLLRFLRKYIPFL